MSKKDISKADLKKLIESFFSDIKNKTPTEIKKIKRKTMNQKISLKDYKHLFCKKCLFPYSSPKIRIKNKMKSFECGNCGNITRRRIK